MRATHREIGGDFEYEPQHGTNQQLPWARGVAAYFQTGRQAIQAIACKLHLDGSRKVHLAVPFCQSMVSPWGPLQPVIHTRITPAWLATTSPDDVVFLQTLYGMEPAPEILASVERVRARGVKVVADFTHRPFGWDPTKADISIASLRKLLPLPDGAVAVGIANAATPADATATNMRLRAMQTKGVYLREHGPKNHLTLFEAAESALTRGAEPRQMSTYSQDWLAAADLSGMAAARARNGAVLAQAVTQLGIPVVNPPKLAPVPSHLVIRYPQRDALRRHLAQSGIYCPVHWARPDKWNASWPDDILSLPVDHRYTAEDMDHIAVSISNFTRKDC